VKRLQAFKFELRPNVVRFATLSDGTFYAPLNSFRRHATALRKGQQALCRKQKFSRNWKKAKGRIQRLHARIGNARRDYLHKISTAISQKHAMVCIEDLQVRNMSKSAAGSAETPGKQVRAKAGLNKSILDQGWFEFRRQLQYKLSWNGGELIVVPPRNTSRRCPECDYVSGENRQTQERFACTAHLGHFLVWYSGSARSHGDLERPPCVRHHGCEPRGGGPVRDQRQPRQCR
jgi:putative transposase